MAVYQCNGMSYAHDNMADVISPDCIHIAHIQTILILFNCHIVHSSLNIVTTVLDLGGSSSFYLVSLTVILGEPDSHQEQIFM